MFAGVGFMIGAAVIGVLNFHLYFIRPRLYAARHGSMEGYRFISGYPLIGTFLILWGVIMHFGAVGSGLIGMVVYAIDVNGVLWFVIFTRRDRSLWDEKKVN